MILFNTELMVDTFFVVITGGFLVIAIGEIIVMYLTYRKSLRLLKYGIKVKGRFINKVNRHLFSVSNDEKVISNSVTYYFKYVDENGKEHAFQQTSGSPNFFDKVHHPGQAVWILHDPQRLQMAKALDLINGAPYIVSDSEITREQSTNSLKNLMINLIMLLLTGGGLIEVGILIVYNLMY